MRQSLEPQLLSQFIEYAAKQGNAGGFREEIERACYRRFDKGGEEHGPDAFWDTPIPPEIADESIDLINWPYLELLKLYRKEAEEGPSDEADAHRADLFELACLGARAFLLAQKLRERDSQCLHLASGRSDPRREKQATPA
jgi:hypothetical protein